MEVATLRGQPAQDAEDSPLPVLEFDRASNGLKLLWFGEGRLQPAGFVLE